LRTNRIPSREGKGWVIIKVEELKKA